MHHRDLVQPWSMWTHVKTGNRYVVLCVAHCSTNGERDMKEESVVYMATYSPNMIYYRELTEFLDGRFDPVPIY